MDIQGMVKGLHHITATVNDAQEDYDFYTQVLGLRLVKQTVNFDNDKVYHFYYANKLGSPGTVFTTFPYKGQGVRDGTIGAGQVTHSALSVPEAAIGFWADRLAKKGVSVREDTLFGWPTLDFRDPAGLNLRLVGAPSDDRQPVWKTGSIGEGEAIRGLHHAHLSVHDDAETAAFLEEFGYTIEGEEGHLTLFRTGNGAPGDLLILEHAPDAPRGKNGLGTVHHVAHRVASLEDSKAIKAFAEAKGFKVTDILDRKYFQSIYFRIPGGVLFEVATSGPGFTVDEGEGRLGSSLMLPDWQEKHRARIEEQLPGFTA